MATEANQTTNQQQTTQEQIDVHGHAVQHEKPAASQQQTQQQAKPQEKPVEAKPEAKKTETAAKTEGAAASTGLKKHTVQGDDEIPEDADLIELSASALKRRLDRHTKKELRDRFGTDDPDAIKKKLDKLADYESKEEDRRKAQLSKEEKLQEERDNALRRAEEAEQRTQALHEDRIVEQEDGRLKDLATKHIKAKYWKHVARDLAEFLRDEYTEEQLANLKDKDIENWLTKTYLKENPEYAKEPTETKGLTNSPKEEDRPSPSQDQNNKNHNFSPRGPNAMSSRDARSEAKKLGISWT